MSEGEPFELLHPALQHHIVNSLGWRSLRPLQSESIEPIIAGHHALAMAPTAGGKTEAAVFPVLSRMLTDDWRGMTVLYICPLRALLNNLHVRLSGYAELVGRRVGLWHGDVTAGERKRLMREPPDILLTTPESLESMLVSTGVSHDAWFGQLRTVVIDEAHAFVGDDRGWHLLAVLARVSKLAGRELQRIALSATIGNPDDVLEWLTTGCDLDRRVVNPPVLDSSSPEVTLDFVGSLSNAAIVISRLHRGSKRLAFVDSRARAEKLASGLREAGVTTFVSHGSLGLDERRQAEQAFAEARDCVIVATSTLELGIDVGDLDHVIQIDAPPTVASFLQRLGRTGRRQGSSRNMTLLATSDRSLLLASSVLLRWSEGYVEPTVPPALPLHLVGQQLLALTLQEGQIGNNTWSEWFGKPFVFGPEVAERAGSVLDHLVAERYLIDGGAGMLSIGDVAEAELGRRHFMELLAVFTAPPLFSVRHGRLEVGHVPDEALFIRPPGSDRGPTVLLLGGKGWLVKSIDWRRRVIHVEPTDQPGVARWTGGGAPLSSALARGVREVLTGACPQGVEMSRRATDQLDELRDEYRWVRSDGTTLVNDGRARWWTFAGQRANTWLASFLSEVRTEVTALDGLSIALDSTVDLEQLRRHLEEVQIERASLAAWVSEEAAESLKFSDCLPSELVAQEVSARLRDDNVVVTVLHEPKSSFNSERP
ncbi:MAG: DEAD/DEAH box helicase [Ilumatobacter fluminis]|uniref:DEAD/DEAH box helicase n=1 Tax=Ilumatobacter fluminis TaxID=467091 RepID=UPI0032EBEBB5